MNIEKIQIGEYFVWVDKNVTTMTNTPMGYCYNSLKSESDWTDKDIVLHQGTIPIYHYRGLQKIIAADKELNLEGVPTYVEYLAEQHLIDINSKVPKDLERDSWIKLGFIKGYQTKEREKSDELLTKYQGGITKGLEMCKELPTWGTVKKALSEAFKASQGGYNITTEEIIEQLKKSKL